jgi:hypothetical protein
MIDVNKITSTLAKLPDQQLQQYAQMHKNDPYIMALAMSESNRRKEMRASGQGAMQEQPKVVDQMVAEMAPQQLPEDQGIGQLPAGDMNFADGGIIAFADGGDVERYQSQGLVQDPRLASLLAARERYLRAGSDTSGIDQAIAFIQAKSSQGPAPTAAPANTPMGGDFAEQMMQGVTAPTFAPAPSFTPAVNRSMLNKVEQPARANTAVYGAPAKAEDKGTGKDRTDRGAPTDKAAAKLPGQADLATLYQDILGKQNFQDPAAEASLQLEAQERANAAADRQAIAQDAERFKDAYKGREGRLAEREADIGKQKGTNTGLAFLNAGLAIMSTPGGLASAIGKGAQVGTAQFAAGLDKIRSAQERLGEARDRLDDMKLNREEVTAKDLRDAERKYREVAVTAQKRTIDGVRQAAGVNEARAKNIYDKTVDMTKTVYEQEQANKRSAGQVAATLQSPERMAYMSALEKTKTKENPQGDPAAAYQSIIAMKREPVSIENLRKDWLDTAKKMEIQSSYPNIKTFEDYVTVFGGGAGAGGGAGGDGLRVVGVR